MVEDPTTPGEVELNRRNRGEVHVGVRRDVAPESVVVRDVRMPFGSMVVFMVKWAIASIPALIILIVLGVLISAFAAGLIASLVGFGSLPSRPSNPKVASPSIASTHVAETSVSETAEAAYLRKVLVRKVEVGRSVLDEPGVFGEVKNTGDQTLKEVEITIFCLDSVGKAVFEKTYHPVLVSSLSFGDASQPLRPGYSRQFGVKLDDAPSDWAKKVDVKVTKVQFQ
jgi:hypothetical protein